MAEVSFGKAARCRTTTSAICRDSVRNNLPKHTQEIYRGVYNSAEDRYGEESRAHRVAWSAVEHKYEKNDQDDWV